MRRILIQFDTDAVPSVFDRVVAVDAGIDELFSYGGVTPDRVEPLVHGAIFTRGPADLKHTAIYIGGSDVEAGQRLFDKVTGTFFGPLRVSVMIDSNRSSYRARNSMYVHDGHGIRCTFASISPGSSHFPLRSTTAAPDGTGTADAGPAARILPSGPTSTTPNGIGSPPSPSMTVAPV